jgi:plasmid replication initiation protein
MKSTIKIILSFTLILSFFTSCNSEANQKKKLKQECVSMLSKEIKGTLKSTLDGTTFGLGSIVMDFAMTEKQQDSLIISPIVKDLNKALDKKSIEELKELKTSKPKRYLLIAEALKEKAPVIKENVSKIYGKGAELIDGLMSGFSKSE